MKKVTVIGHFGGKKVFLDGQTVKTKIVTEELIKKFGNESVGIHDTFGERKKAIFLPAAVFKMLRESENVVLLPAQNGVRVIAPLLSIENIFFHRKLHYVVIGGWLPDFLKKHKMLKRVLKKIDGIYVETNTMKDKLEVQGFRNVYVMPNCKELNILDESELVYPNGEPYKLCTFSRVMREKGIEDAVRAVQAVNEKYGKTVLTLDVYGQVDKNQTEWFERLSKAFPPYIKYSGTVDPNNSVSVIKNYFLLLFPTKYYTEGIPGTILDAFASGVPVLSSEWGAYSDVLNNQIAMTYPFDDYNALVDALQYSVENPSSINGMKMNCLKAAKEYLPSKVVQTIADVFEADNR